MNRIGKNSRVLLLFTTGLVLCHMPARADVTTLHLVSQSGESTTLGGVYTSPYAFNNNPNSNANAFLLLACDDFATDINFGDYWQANEISLSNVSNPPPAPKFPAPTITQPDGITLITNVPNKPTDAQAYDAAAFLAEQILFPAAINPMAPSLASYAIWQIFDDQAVDSLGSSDRTTVYSYLATAFSPANDKVNPHYNVTIYTPTTGTTNRPKDKNGVAITQEFIGVSVPEAATVTFLGFFLAMSSCLFALNRRFRSASQRRN